MVIKKLNKYMREEEYVKGRVTEAEMTFKISVLNFDMKKFFYEKAKECDVEVVKYKEKNSFGKNSYNKKKINVQCTGIPEDLEKLYFQISSMKGVGMTLQMIIY